MSAFLNAQGPSETQMDGENIRRMFYLFLNEFQAKNSEGNVVYFYREEAYNMMKNKRTTMNISFRHVMERDSNLMEAITFDFYKYRFGDIDISLFAKEPSISS